MINLGDAVLFFKGDMNDLDRALGQARAAAEDSLGNMKQLAFEAGAAMTAMGAGIVGALGVTVTNFANTGDEVNDLSKKIGFSTEEVSKWAFALGQSGGDMSMLQTGVRGLANAIDAQKTATAAAAIEYQEKLPKAMEAGGDAVQQLTASLTDTTSVFARLGISVEMLQALTPEEQFMRMAMAVAAIPDPMERAALAQDVFGKAGMDLLPVLSEGEAGLRAMFDQAERAGVVFSPEEAALADAYNDALGELSASAAGLGKELAVALTPSLIEAANWIKDTVISIKDWAEENPELAATVVKVAAGVGAFMFVAGPLLMILPGIVTAAGLIGPVFTAIGAAIAAVVGVVSVPFLLIAAGVIAVGLAAWALYENWEEVKQYLSDGWDYIKEIFTKGIEEVAEWLGWIAGNIYQAFTDPVDFLKEYWQGMFDFFDWVWLKLGQGVDWVMKNVIDPVWKKLTEFYNWLVDIFSGAFSKAFGDASGVTIEGNTTEGFAGGTLSAPGGLAWVGEQGPELMYVPRGAQVYPADQSAAMASGGTTVTINIGGVTLPNRAAIQEFNRGLGDEVSRRLSMRGLSTRLA